MRPERKPADRRRDHLRLVRPIRPEDRLHEAPWVPATLRETWPLWVAMALGLAFWVALIALLVTR